MKYSDFLKLVRLTTAMPWQEWDQVRSEYVPRGARTEEAALCWAISRALLEPGIPDLDWGKRAVARVQAAQNTAYQRAFYPDWVAAQRGIDEATALSARWRQTVRHQLLDRMIGEALVEEADHGQDQ